MTSPLLDTLTKAGLDPVTAQVYLALVELGETQVGLVQQKTQLSRASVYDALSLLLAEGYIEYRKVGRVAYYKPVHPQKLEELIEQKKRDVALLEGEMKETIRALTGTFNLAFNKPGVRFFEGIEGIKEMLDDTLTHNSQKLLYTYTDLAGYSELLKDWNTKYYAPKRKELGIKLQGFVNDNEPTRKFLEGYQATELTEIIFTDYKLFPFFTEINIYEDSVSFASFSKDVPVGVLIQNKEIHATMKSIFEFSWSLAKKYEHYPQPTWKKEEKPKDNLGSLGE